MKLKPQVQQQQQLTRCIYPDWWGYTDNADLKNLTASSHQLLSHGNIIIARQTPKRMVDEIVQCNGDDIDCCTGFKSKVKEEPRKISSTNLSRMFTIPTGTPEGTVSSKKTSQKIPRISANYEVPSPDVLKRPPPKKSPPTKHKAKKKIVPDQTLSISQSVWSFLHDPFVNLLGEPDSETPAEVELPIEMIQRILGEDDRMLGKSPILQRTN